MKPKTFNISGMCYYLENSLMHLYLKPLYFQVRVLDCYLVEGPKVLYRIGLAVLNLFNKQSGKFRC